VTSTSCQGISSIDLGSFLQLENFFAKENQLDIGSGLADNALSSTLGKRATPLQRAMTYPDLRTYQASCPQNQIPAFVTVTNRDGNQAARYTQADMWRACKRALTDIMCGLLTQMIPSILVSNSPLGPTRITTHRGEPGNALHWGTPTDAASRMLPPAQLVNVPGVPQPIYNFLLGAINNNNQDIGAILIDAPAPVNAWNFWALQAVELIDVFLDFLSSRLCCAILLLKGLLSRLSLKGSGLDLMADPHM
jgi:hypothetical protein